MLNTPDLTRSERTRGFIAMAVCLVVLPLLVDLLPDSFSAARKNVICYFLNFAIVGIVFRSFLGKNLRIALPRLFPTIYYAALGYLAQAAFGQLLSEFIWHIAPEFHNLNDHAIISHLSEDLIPLAFSMLILVPVAEECFFRGLLFRGFYARSAPGAWVLSAGLFAAIHVVGFIGTYEPLHLLLAFIQYLPAGIALCFAYQRSGTIISPILMHALVNAMALYNTIS